MRLYFSGFSLKNEENLFDEYLEKSDFIVSGFSYGAIKAFEYVLNTDKRIDKLQLFSPAYFNDKDKKYKRMQMIYFKKNSGFYCNKFLRNCGFSNELSSKYFELGTNEELYQLLNYKWDVIKLNILLNRNIKLEFYVGDKDRIINTQKALEFFKQFGEVYYIKSKGHIL
jgi:hypothetical protein